MIQKIRWHLGFLLILSSCSSLQIKHSQQSFNILFTGARWLELEPCGCSMGPIGGVHRELNFYQSLKETWLSVSSGPSFYPKGVNHAKDQAKLFEKAKLLVQAMNELQVSVYSPSVEDLSFGVERFRELMLKAKFEVISTNLYFEGSPIFEPYFRWQDAIFIGVSHLGSSQVQKIEVKDPVTTIRSILASLNPKPNFIILLSSLTESEEALVEKEFPEIKVILGGLKDTPGLFQRRTNLLSAKASQDGKEILKLKFDLTPNFDSFYNEKIAKETKSALNIWKGELKKLSDSKRKGDRLKRKQYEKYIKENEKIATEKSQLAMEYTYEFISLNRQYELPHNKLFDLVEKFKQGK